MPKDKDLSRRPRTVEVPVDPEKEAERAALRLRARHAKAAAKGISGIGKPRLLQPPRRGTVDAQSFSVEQAKQERIARRVAQRERAIVNLLNRHESLTPPMDVRHVPHLLRRWLRDNRNPAT